MRTILTEHRKKIIENIRKTGIMSAWDEFALIPPIYEESLCPEKLKNIRL